MRRFIGTIAVGAVLIAATASAQMMGGGNGMIGGGGVQVAADGTALLLQPCFAEGATTPSGLNLIAVAPAGNVAWRYGLELGMHNLAIAGNLVIVVQGDLDQHMSGAAPTAQPSKVRALQLANGVEAWQVPLTE